jgi:hypothetical protein
MELSGHCDILAHLLSLLPVLATAGCVGCCVLGLLHHKITAAGSEQGSDNIVQEIGHAACCFPAGWDGRLRAEVVCWGHACNHMQTMAWQSPCGAPASQTHLICSCLVVGSEGLSDGAPEGLQEGALGLLLRFLHLRVSLCWHGNKATFRHGHEPTKTPKLHSNESDHSLQTLTAAGNMCIASAQ